jgi:mannose-6-phosphate isomerase-like protein (cupin superfamily)/DNA-binding XRE family transcriptional regulator
VARPKADLRAAAEAEVEAETDGAAAPGRRDDLGQIVQSIGPKIRRLRQLKGLSLQQLGERSDISAAAIHKIERNGMVPTITTLMKLAVALNRPLSYFVEEDAGADGPVVFIGADERRPVFTSKGGLELTSISGPYGRFFMAGASARIEPLADSGAKPMEHPGEELVHLLEGRLEFEVDGDTYRLTPGDSLHFRTDRPHRWRNPGREPARAVWMALRPM